MKQFTDVVFSNTQPPVILSGASLFVYTDVGYSVDATIYQDDGITPYPTNEVIADSSGRVSFYAADGRYYFKLVKTGYTTIFVPDIEIADVTQSSTSDAVWQASSMKFNGSTSGSATIQAQATGADLIYKFPSAAPALNNALVASGVSGSTTTLGWLPWSAPDSDTPIRYVSYYGDDANDGLTLASAKQHIMVAYDSLPAAGGVIYIVSGAAGEAVIADVDTATNGTGIWIMGNSFAGGDPNYASPPTGWRHAKTHVSFIGITSNIVNSGSVDGAALISAGKQGDNLHPAIWLSSIAGQVTFQNLQYQYPDTGIKVGIDSTNTKSEAGGVAGITFQNIHGATNLSAGAGPNVDVGYAFWIYFRSCSFNGTASANGVLTEKGAAINFSGTTPASHSAYLIFLYDQFVNGGGVRYISWTVGSSALYVENLSSENQLNGDAAVYIVGSGTFNGVVDGVYCDDFTGTVTGVRYEGTGLSPDSLCVRNIRGGGENCVGPVSYTTSQYSPYNQLITTLPAAQGATGILGRRLWAQCDTARRNFHPTAIRYPNLANQLVANWTKVAGTETFTGSKLSPDGVLDANAVEVSGPPLPAPNGGPIFYTTATTPNAGDTYICGVWSRTVTATGYFGGFPAFFQLTGCTSENAPFGSGQSYVQTDFASYLGDGEWVWSYAIYKVATAGASTLIFKGLTDATHTIEYFAPILIKIPVADALSDNEIAEYAMNLATYPDGISTTGTIAGLRGRPLAFGGTGDSFMAILDHSVLTANRTLSVPDTTGTILTTSDATARVYSGAQTTRATVRAEVGLAGAIGSLYLSSAGKVYMKVANANATTDWQKITATAAD
jgi:hypothetical protein